MPLPFKILIHPHMVRSLTGGLLNAENLFDGNTATAWFPGWDAAHYPAVVLIDLQKSYFLSHIRIFDGTGKPRLRFYGQLEAGAPWQSLAEVRLEAYLQWVEVEAVAEVRWIKIELVDIEGDQVAGEIEFYANREPQKARPRAADAPPLPESAAPPLIQAKTGLAALLGCNGFHWVPLSLLQPFRLYREYQCWEWMEAEKGLNRFEPTDGASGNYDTHYRQLKAAGIKPIACINQTPEWLLQDYPKKPSRKDFKPVPRGESTTEPRSYRHFARFLFQLASRYGRARADAQQLTIHSKSRWTGDGPNVPKTGLDLLEYIEVWNEPDKWWSDPEAFFSPDEYAAMLSACYDGHEGRLGAGHGIKKADPSMQVVMAGLSNFNLDYLKGMNDWFKKHRRDKKFAAEIVNFHHYSNKNQALKPNFETGIAPEADQLREKLRALIHYTRQELPGKVFWLSEFGYDTRQNSPQRAEPSATFDAETVQGMWIVRSYIEAIAAGVDAVFVYNIIDEDSEENGLFQSSGLARSAKAGFIPKKAWKMVQELSENLQDAVLTADMSAGQLRSYAFEKNGQTFTLSWSLNNTLSGMPQKH